MDEPHFIAEDWQALATQLQQQRVADLAVIDSLKAENATLRQHNDQLTAQNAQLLVRVSELSEQVSKLTLLLDEQRRAGKRQAAPFSKGPPNPNPKRPGRKSGENYGKHHRRETPQKIDETHSAPLPTACPHCGGHEWVDETLQYQYQVEIPREVIHRRFDIECAKCCRCGERTQGRHPLQTSDAVGAAGVQLGANLHAAATVLNKELGLTHGKVQRAFQLLFDVKIARSTLVRSMLRTAQRALPAMSDIVKSIQASDTIKVDETGWKVSGLKRWLHVIVGVDAVLYQIGSRGAEVLESIIGLDFDGDIIHDGFSSYLRFRNAGHQQCISHLLKRCSELILAVSDRASEFPMVIKSLLKEALIYRDRFLDEDLTLPGVRRHATQLTNRLNALISAPQDDPDNERFAKFLRQHLSEIFYFLNNPKRVSATNNESEFELRYNVIARKLSGGNRSETGVEAQEVLPSVIRTCRKQNRDPFDWLRQLLTSRTPPPLLPTQ